MLIALCVNLPRWGLKQSRREDSVMPDIGVNLPRWGLKHFPLVVKFPDNIECKFTPLGFETFEK